MDKYVFLKVLENQDQVMIDPEYVIVPLLLHHDSLVFEELHVWFQPSWFDPTHYHLCTLE